MVWVACQYCKLNHHNFGDREMYFNSHVKKLWTSVVTVTLGNDQAEENDRSVSKRSEEMKAAYNA